MKIIRASPGRLSAGMGAGAATSVSVTSLQQELPPAPAGDAAIPATEARYDIRGVDREDAAAGVGIAVVSRKIESVAGG